MRHAEETASRYAPRLVENDGSNKDRAVVCCHDIERVSKSDLWKYYSLYDGMWNLFCRAGHYPCVQDLLWSIQRRNPPCNVEDSLRVGLIVIEAWFTGYWGSPGLGGIRTAGLLDYEDTRLKTSSHAGW